MKRYSPSRTPDSPKFRRLTSLTPYKRKIARLKAMKNKRLKDIYNTYKMNNLVVGPGGTGIRTSLEMNKRRNMINSKYTIRRTPKRLKRSKSVSNMRSYMYGSGQSTPKRKNKSVPMSPFTRAKKYYREVVQIVNQEKIRSFRYKKRNILKRIKRDMRSLKKDWDVELKLNKSAEYDFENFDETDSNFLDSFKNRSFLKTKSPQNGSKKQSRISPIKRKKRKNKSFSLTINSSYDHVKSTLLHTRPKKTKNRRRKKKKNDSAFLEEEKERESKNEIDRVLANMLMEEDEKVKEREKKKNEKSVSEEVEKEKDIDDKNFDISSLLDDIEI